MAAKKRAKAKKAGAKAKPAPKTAPLQLSAAEAEFLRDLMGLVIPVDAEDGGLEEGNASAALAAVTDRVDAESDLWDKVTVACMDLGVEVGEHTPSYAVSPTRIPGMHVYEMDAPDPSDG